MSEKLKLIEKSGLLYSFNEQSLCEFLTANKSKLEKKNAELVEVREFRKKLDDKEKEICAAIEGLQNRKVEVIFEQVKKEIKNKNLDISSVSVLSIVDALKNNQQILQTEEISGEVSEDGAEEILEEEKSTEIFSSSNSAVNEILKSSEEK